MKILITNPFGIGDVIFTTPVMNNIKQDLPHAQIAYLCNARVAPMLEADPRLYKVFVYEKDEFRSLWKQSKISCIKKILRLYSDIKKERFDYVLDFSLAGEFAFLFWLCGIKNRIGYNYKNRGRFLNQTLELEGFQDKHVVEYYLKLLKFMDIYPTDKNINIYAPDDAKESTRKLFESNNVTGDNLVAVMPGGGASWGHQRYKKLYAADKFASVCDKLIKEKGASILLFGSSKEAEIVDKVKNSMKEEPSLVSTSLSLKEFVGVLSNTKLLLCNDSGPLHIAVGLGIPTVSIFGPVDEKVYGPYPQNEKHKVVVADFECRPCYHHFIVPICHDRRCLDELEPQQVFDACSNQLNRKA